MAKSQRPLSLLVDPEFLETEEAQKLQAQGHTLDPLPQGYDVVWAPIAWRRVEPSDGLSVHMLKEAQKRRYPKKQKEESDND